MATGPALRGNDENVRPDYVNRPNDEDRERFGFTKRKSRVACQSSGIFSPRKERPSTAEPLTARPDRKSTPLAARADANTGPLTARPGSGAGLASARSDGAAAAPVALVPLVDSTLGDPEATLRLLRTKPAAPKYDFKGRINELTDHNRALRAALIEERERRKQLADVLSRSEADINTRLRAVAGEADECRRRLDTQGKLEKMVQEAVRSVWREETGAGQDPAAAARRGDEAPNPTRLEVAELQAQLEALRQCSASETSRALRAELLLREREEELARTKQRLQELEASSAREGEAITRARAAAELVRDAGGLLQQQKEEYDEKFRMLSVMAQQREEELAAELAKSTARCTALEQQLSTSRS